MMAHAAGSEWHDKSKSPLVVDFSPPSQTEIKSIGGMDQWLASQGQAVNASPRAAVTGKNRVLIIRVHFSDSTQRLSNAQLVTNWLEPLNTLFRTTSNGKNDGWDFDFYGPVNVSSRSTYVRPNNQMNDDSANNMQKLVDDVVDASDEDDLEPLLDQADTRWYVQWMYRCRLRKLRHVHVGCYGTRIRPFTPGIQRWCAPKNRVRPPKQLSQRI